MHDRITGTEHMDSRFRTFPISEALALEPELQRMGLKLPLIHI